MPTPQEFFQMSNVVSRSGETEINICAAKERVATTRPENPISLVRLKLEGSTKKPS
ncbi:hypothetical protein H6S82_10580 [Planktothrix sp. FACHB-1355]|uniref:hypothetical protein n=1 Tax=Oscillatoriophycideae TaxID=1301283 RepID=UPI001686760B|nr:MULTISPECIES: hypothetical protein [Oscillatoriales]MBD3559306.1 hypothetical protein [Planktothrix sp. FACHB-1355]